MWINLIISVKDEYIQLVIEWRFINRVRKQMDQVSKVLVTLSIQLNRV